MRGMKSEDLNAMLDFLYYGEANVYQERLESFFAVAEEFQLKGFRALDASAEKLKLPIETKHINAQKYAPEITKKEMRTISQIKSEPNEAADFEKNRPTTSDGNAQKMDKTIKSMMEKSTTMIQHGTKREYGRICKVCGKEGRSTSIKSHIYSHHIKKGPTSCSFCGKVFMSGRNMNCHISTVHKER